MSAAVVELDRTDRLRRRAHQIRTLIERAEAELAAIDRELDPDAPKREARNAANRRWRAKRREVAKQVVEATSTQCGTDRGYSWHRTHGPWPLPVEDPCGCRGAHAEAERDRKRR